MTRITCGNSGTNPGASRLAARGRLAAQAASYAPGLRAPRGARAYATCGSVLPTLANPPLRQTTPSLACASPIGLDHQGAFAGVGLTYTHLRNSARRSSVLNTAMAFITVGLLRALEILRESEEELDAIASKARARRNRQTSARGLASRGTSSASR